ncbi:T9SS type A sorting domain-containing protein [candidate division KSB1 bacterium]|nr:T9SS type A sorting domain-containing protein [candidate division KSB1 bacterium]
MRLNSSISGFCLSLLFCVASAHGQPAIDTLWTRHYGSELRDFPGALVRLSDGSFLMVGSVENNLGHADSDMRIIRADSSGTLLWMRQLGDRSRVESLSEIALTQSGRAVAWGGSTDLAFQDPLAFLTVVSDFGDTLQTAYFPTTIVVKRILPLSSGGLVLAGSSLANYDSTGYDFALEFVDSAFSIVRQRVFGGAFDEDLHDAISLRDHGLLLVGSGMSFTPEHNGSWIIRCEENGDSLWSRVLGRPEVGGAINAAIETPNHQFSLAGEALCYYSSGWLNRIASNGDTLWSRCTYVGFIPTDAIATADNGMIMVGWRGGPTQGLVVMQTNANGDSVWSHFYQDLGGLDARMVPLPDGGFAVLTSSYSDAAWIDFHLMRFTVGNSAAEQSPSVSHKFDLLPSYPNPFNSGTVIEYITETDGDVLLEVFDLTGRHLRTLVNDRQPGGAHRVMFSAPDLPSGVYFYRLQANQQVKSRKLLLIR